MQKPTGHLGRRDWLEGGQRLLRREGVGGLKLRALAETLGVSTGSFYHHFTDFDAFLAALAHYYSGEQLAENIAIVRREAATPYDRIVRAAQLAHEIALPELMEAMRAWARRDPAVAEDVAKLEQGLLDFMAENFEGLGFSPGEAATRSFVLLSTAAAGVTQPDLEGGRLQLGALIIDLVTRDPPGG